METHGEICKFLARNTSRQEYLYNLVEEPV